VEGGVAELAWGEMSLRSLTRVAPAEEHARTLEARIHGRPAPQPRLGDVRLA
jgi:hypothetical protein